MALEVQNKSLLKIIYSVQEQLSGFNVTDDTPYSEEFLKDLANVFRSALIKEEINQTKLVSDSYYQSMCCLEVICREQSCVSGSETVKSGSKQYYVELPKLIGGVGNNDIKYLGLDDYKNGFIRTNLLGFNTSDGDKYGRMRTRYMMVGKEAILKNIPTKGLKYVCLIGLLDDPTTSCLWDADVEYPLPNHLIVRLETLMLKQILSTYNIKPDLKNDGLPGNAQQNIKQSNQEGNE